MAAYVGSGLGAQGLLAWRRKKKGATAGSVTEAANRISERDAEIAREEMDMHVGGDLLLL